MDDFTSNPAAGGGLPVNPFEEQTNLLGQNIERLKILYEQYFLGRERMAPQTLRSDVDKSMQQLVGGLSQVNNTSLRFRIKSLQAKLISLRRYWDRTMQEIEDGTYRRDRFKLKLHAKKAEEEKPKAAANETAKTPAAAAKAADKRNASIETLLGQYIDAKKKCNESVSGLSYEAFSKTIASQSATLKKKFQCKSVRFKVVIENGKPKLKATPV